MSSPADAGETSTNVVGPRDQMRDRCPKVVTSAAGRATPSITKSDSGVAAGVVEQVRHASVTVEASARTHQADAVAWGGRRHVDIPSIQRRQSLLSRTGVEVAPRRWERAEALRVIGGQLSREEGVRPGRGERDDGQCGKQDEGDGEAGRNESRPPRRGGGRSVMARDGGTAGAQPRWKRFVAQPVRSLAQDGAPALLLRRRHATRRTRIEMLLDVSAFRGRERLIHVGGQAVGGAAAITLGSAHISSDCRSGPRGSVPGGKFHTRGRLAESFEQQSSPT